MKKELVKQLKEIKELTELQLEYEDVYKIMAHTIEEFGEFSAAVCAEDGGVGKAYKKGTLKESSKEEGVDLIICAFSAFFARGGTIKQFNEICPRKLKKWKENQKI